MFSDTINTGIYVLEPDVLDWIPTDEPYDFSKELFPRLLDAGAPLYGYVADGYWQDIGNIAQYQEANRDALDGKVKLDIPGLRLRENVYVGEGSLAENLELIRGPAVIGNYCAIDPSAKIGRYTVLGNNVIVKEFCETEYCVVDANTYLGPRIAGAGRRGRQELRGAGARRHLRRRGDRRRVLDRRAERDRAQRSHLSLQARRDRRARAALADLAAARHLDPVLGRRRGGRGSCNVDVTPESATRLAMAYGTTLGRGDRVVASRDAHPASRMIKRAMIAGLVATGVSVEDLRVAASAVNRFEVKNTAAAGGLHVQVSERDPELMQIMFFESNGILATEQTRKDIEKYFNRQEVRRALINQLGELAFPPRVNGVLRRGAAAQDRRRADPLEALPDRGRLRVLERGAGDAGAAAPAARRVVLGALVHGPRRGGDPHRRPAGLHEPTAAAWWRRWAPTSESCSTTPAERIILIDERAREIPADTTLHLLLRLVSRHAERRRQGRCCRRTRRWSPPRSSSGRGSRWCAGASAPPG